MDDGNDPKTPINFDHDAAETSQSHADHCSIPVIPTEDSYFSEAPARPKSLGLRDLGIILNSKRRATLHVAIRGAGTAWIDQDDSGTYDPDKDRATSSPFLTPPRRRRRARAYDEDDESVTPRTRPRKRPPVGYRSLMTFSFTSERALNYLRSLAPGPFDSQSTTLDEGLSDSSGLGEEYDFGPPLKKRKIRRLRKVRETSEREDGLTIDQLTIGHPQRRGCKACFEVGDDDCSLIEKGQDYPCTACDDASIDCEYIIPPELKKSCGSCKRKRISCSYRLDGGKGVESCNACAEEGAKCLAGPLKGSIRKPDDASSTTALPPRQYVACNQCRNNNLRCTFKTEQSGPCSNCRKHGEDCQFVLILASNPPLSVTSPPGKSKRNQKAGKKQSRKVRPDPPHDPDVDHSPGRHEGRLETTLLAEAFYHGYGKRKPKTLLNERARYIAQTTQKQEKLKEEARRRSASTKYTPGFTPPLGISGGIPHIRITTAFSHPIKFNYIPDPLRTSPCDWCHSSLFGIYGYGNIEVEVVPFPAVDGNGYEEMPGGHADNGHPCTQMCVSCTNERVGIMGCEYHEFQAVEVDPRHSVKGELENSYFALTVGDSIGGQLATNMKWCAICPTAANFRCCARTAEDNLIDEITGEGRGCGLYLCEGCKDLMGKINGAGSRTTSVVLDRTIYYAANDRFTYDRGVRADASFLTSTGELMVRIQKGMGENSTESDGEDGAQSSEGEDGDEQIWTILERMGRGKGKWNEKQKPPPGTQKPGQGPMQQPKQATRGGIGSKRKSSSRELQVGFGAEFVFESDRGSSSRRKAGQVGGGESSGMDMGKYGSSSKGKGKGKTTVSEVAISDSEYN